MIDYKIKQLDGAECQIVLTYTAEKWIIDRLFKLTTKKLKVRQHIDRSLIKSFDIPEEIKKHYCPALHKAVRRHIREIIREARKDNVIITHTKCTNAIYNQLKTGKWQINIILKGIMVKA